MLVLVLVVPIYSITFSSFEYNRGETALVFTTWIIASGYVFIQRR